MKLDNSLLIFIIQKQQSISNCSTSYKCGEVFNQTDNFGLNYMYKIKDISDWGEINHKNLNCVRLMIYLLCLSTFCGQTLTHEYVNLELSNIL